MTATSIASWKIAAGTGASHPTVAAAMANVERPMPTTMLSTAIRRARCAKDGFRHAIEAVGEDDHVGGLGGGARSAGSERDAGRIARYCTLPGCSPVSSRTFLPRKLTDIWFAMRNA